MGERKEKKKKTVEILLENLTALIVLAPTHEKGGVPASWGEVLSFAKNKGALHTGLETSLYFSLHSHSHRYINRQVRGPSTLVEAGLSRRASRPKESSPRYPRAGLARADSICQQCSRKLASPGGEGREGEGCHRLACAAVGSGHVTQRGPGPLPRQQGPDLLQGTLGACSLSVGGTEHSPCTMLWEPTVPSLPLPLVLGEWVCACLDVPIYRIGTVLCIVF